MITKCFETMKSCYFEGVSFHIIWNCPTESRLSGNDSFFTVQVCYQDPDGVRFEDLEREFDTQDEAARYARKWDSNASHEAAEIRANVQ